MKGGGRGKRREGRRQRRRKRKGNAWELTARKGENKYKERREGRQ